MVHTCNSSMQHLGRNVEFEAKKQKLIKTYCLWKINITKLFIRQKHFFPWASLFFPWVSLFLGSVYHFINTNFIEIRQRIPGPKAQQAQFSLGLLRALSWPWGTGGGRNECRLWRNMVQWHQWHFRVTHNLGSYLFKRCVILLESSQEIT